MESWVVLITHAYSLTLHVEWDYLVNLVPDDVRI